MSFASHMKRHIDLFTIHPLLVAVYPALHLLAQNTASVRPRAAFLSLALSATSAAILWLITGIMLKNHVKGAIFTTLAVTLFFAHGHVLNLAGSSPVAAWLLVTSGSTLLVLTAILLKRWQGNPQPWSRPLDVVALALLIMVCIPLIQSSRSVRSEMLPDSNLPPGAQQSNVKTPLGYLPDIYVIVLDAFGRADKLSEIYNVDLTDLQEYLEQNNFEIATKANANYCQTSLSLAALFNSNYVPKLLPRFKKNYRNKKALATLVRENRNVRRLRDMGYQLVTLTGGSELAVQADPDVNYRGGALNEFQSTLLATTPLPQIASLFASEAGGDLNPFTQHRQGVKYQFEKLPHVQAAKDPKLVFAHILSPHPPFVVNAAGKAITPDYEFSLGERYAWDGYVEGYAGQATWAVNELQKTVAGILAASRRLPVILILGDHGPASRWIEHWHRTNSFQTTDAGIIGERMAIFLALLMPDGKGGNVYPELTPVNVFPLIFERCFGEPAELLDDQSYFSTYQDWSNFWNANSITGSRRNH